MEFEALIVDIEPRLRRAFVAWYGWPAGLDVTADAVEWAWEHRDELATMTNTTGYLYRVGTSRSASPPAVATRAGRTPARNRSDPVATVD